MLSDDLGVAVLSSLLRGSETDALTAVVERSRCSTHDARNVLEGLHATWDRAGLLAAAPPHRTEWTVRHAAANCRYVVHLGVGENLIRVNCGSKEVADRTACTFAEHLLEPPESMNHTVDMVETDGLSTVIRDGRPVWQSPDTEAARLVLFQEIIGILAGEDRVGAIVHGALLERGGKALALAGPSGRGKTTLALALAREGWAYCSDDLFALSKDGHSAISLPTHAHIKPLPTHDRAFSREFTLPERVAPTGVAVPLAALLFPEYRPGSPLARNTLRPVDAVQLLLRSGTEPLRRHRSIAPIVGLARSLPAAAVIYGSTTEALVACEAYSDAPQPRT